MATIADFRTLPQFSGMSDADIIGELSQQYDVSPSELAGTLGVKQNDPGFWTSFKQGLGANLEGVGQAIDDSSDGRPGALTRYGRDVQFRNPSSAASESWEGFKEHPWEGLKQFAGSALGSTAPSLALALIPGMQPEAAASAGVALRGLQLARSLPAQALVAAAPSYGQIRNDQREQGLGDEPGAVGRAALGALATGGVEVGFGVQGALNRFNSRAAREAVVDEFGRTPMRTLAKNWGRSALEEGGEEIVQQPIQQAAAYQDPTTPENLRDTAWSGFGGLVGGAFLGPMGAAPMAVRHAQINGRIATDLLNPDAPLSQQQDAALWQRAFDARDLGAEQAAANYGQTMEEVNRQRLGSLYWGQPVDLLADVQTNEAAREEAQARFDAFRSREARAGFLRDLEGAPHDNPLYAAIPTPVDNYLRQYREDHTPVGENYSLPIPGAFVRGQLPEQATPGYYDGGEEVQPATPNNRQGSFVEQLDMTLQPGYARTQVANDTSVGLPGSTAPTGQFGESGTLANLRAATVQQLVPILQNGGDGAYAHLSQLALTSREPALLAKVAQAARIARQFQAERVAATAKKSKQTKGKAKQAAPAAPVVKQAPVQVPQQPASVPQRRQARVELRQKLEDAKRSQAITEDSYLLLRNALDTGAKVEKVKADLDKAAKEVADARAPNTFDNRADFTDWALNRVGAKEHEAEAYKRWKAIGEFAGEEPASFDMLTQVFPEQTRGKGKGKKPTHTTVQNRMKVLHQLVSDLEVKHLSEAQNESVQTEEVTPGEAISEEEAKTGLTQRSQSADSVVHPEAEGEDKDTEQHGDSGAVGAEVTKRGRKEWEARSTGEEAIKFDDLAPEMQVAWSDAVGSAEEAHRKVTTAKDLGKQSTDAESATGGGREVTIKAYLDKLHSDFVAGVDAANLTQDSSGEGARTVKALSEKDTTGADAARAKVLAESILTGDTDVAAELQQLLEGKTGATLMQMLRTRFSMPRTAVTPKAAVEYLVGKFNTLRAAVVERSNEMAKVWGPGFDSLPEAAKLDFYEAVEGVGDMVNTPSILRQIKGDILNEYGIRQAAESVPANARGNESSDAQRPELRGDGEGVATSGQDQGASGPTVATKKRRTVAREEGVAAGNALFHRKQTVETLKFKDVSGNEYEETVVSFPFATHPHIRKILVDIQNGPMAGTFANIEGFYLYDGKDDFAYKNADGTFKIVLSKTTANDSYENARLTINHELAHVADEADAVRGGTLSNTPMMGIITAKARQLYNRLPEGHPIKELLHYPFDAQWVESQTPRALRMEVFAQLVAAVQHPALARELQAVSPALHQFAKDSLNEIEAKGSAYQTTNRADLAAGVQGQAVRRAEQARSGESQRFRRGQTEQREAAPSFLTQAQGKVADSLVNSRGGFKKHLLGWLTLEQLSDVVERMVDKASSATVTAYNAVMTKMQQASKEIVYRASMIDEKWASVSPAVAAKLSNVMRTATRYGFDPEAEKPGNDFQRKLAAEFNALPSEAKELYKQVRDFYAGLYNERRDILLKAAEGTKDAAGNSAEVKRLLKAVKGPYFPLMRIGEWYSVGMSKEVKALMDKKKTDGLSAAEEKQLAALRKNAKHYVARGHLTRAEAVRSAKELESMGFSNWNTASSKLQNEVRTLPDFQKLEAALVAELPKAVQAKARNMVAEMYFAALADNSALKQLMHREGIYGEETDMRRVFAATALSSAHHISRMKYADDLSAAMMAVRNAASDQTGDDTMRMVENELTKRVELAMDNEHSDFANRLLQTSYFAHLGLSPAFVLTNMSQVPMITAPWLVARHGFGASTRSIVAAYNDVTKMMKSTYSGGNLLAELKWDSVLNEDESKLFRALIDRNKLDITIEADLGSVANMQNTKLDKYIKLANAPVRITELANRAVTGLSAYRLGRSKGMSHDAAVDYAAKAVTETQLDYSALNAPRHMRSVFGSKTIAKLMFQFRKYQQGMLYLIVKNFHDAFKAADPEERRIARTTLYGLFTMSGAMAGAIGLPFAGAVTFIANAIAGGFGDGDDPFDAEVELRNLLADAMGADAAEVFMKGLPTLVGADLSKRVGMGDLASPLPFMRQGKTGSEKLDKAMLASLGASYGMMQQIADGLGEMASGDFAKGAEKVLPLKVASNMIRTARYADEGLTNKNGELILAPEKFSSWDLALRAAGFQPTIEADYYAANQAVESAKQAASDARTKLLRDYAQSTLKGEDTTGIEQKMQDYNERHPEKGYRIDFSAKLKAIQTRVKMQNERNEVGVKTDTRSQPFLQRARFAENT